MSSRNLKRYKKGTGSVFKLVSFCFSSSALPDDEVNTQLQLLECRAQLEHWQGVAKICELSKQEELQDLQRQCDQEIQSLHEAMRGKEQNRN